MKSIIILFLGLLLFIGCKSRNKTNQVSTTEPPVATVSSVLPETVPVLPVDFGSLTKDTVSVSAHVKQAVGPGYKIVEADRNERTLTITLSQLRNAPETIFRPANAAKISYVALETSDSCFIDYITKVVPTQEYYFIQQRYDRLLQFRKDGTFVRQIGFNGRGPEEHVKITEFCADDSGKKVYIIDYVGDIVEYDFEGKFVRKIHCKRENEFIHVWKNKYFILLPENYGGRTPDKLLVTTLKQDTVLKSPNHFFFNIGGVEFVVHLSGITEWNDAILFSQNFRDTVYMYYPDRQLLEVRYCFDFGAERMTSEKMAVLRNNRKVPILDKVICLENFLEDSHSVYFSIADHGKRKNYILDKNSKKIEYLSKGYLVHGHESVPFWPATHDGNTLISVVSSLGAYQQNVDKMDDRSKLKQILKTLPEGSNPLLMLVEPLYFGQDE